MDYLFFGFLTVCIVIAFAMFLAYCYSQEKIKASLKNKRVIKDKEISSETAVDIDKDTKKESNQ